MSIAFVGMKDDRVQSLVEQLRGYGLRHGIDWQFFVYAEETELVYGMLRHAHKAVVVVSDNADGLALAKRLRAAKQECRLGLVTDNSGMAAEGYNIPVQFCCNTQFGQENMAQFFSKMLF